MQTAEKTFDICGIPLSVSGDSYLSRIISAELSSFPSKQSYQQEDSIAVHVSTQNLAPEKKSVCVDDFAFVGKTTILVKLRNPLRESVVKIEGIPLGEKPLVFEVSCDSKYVSDTILKRVTDMAPRLLYSNNLSRLDNIANDFLKLLEGFLHIAMVRKGRAFLHTSAIEKDGQAVLFTGLGGAGKTTCVTELVKSGSFHFLGDDLASVDTNGHVISYPRYMNIYGYNIEQSPEIFQPITNNSSPFEKLCWKIRKRLGMKILRHVSINQVFHEKETRRQGAISKVVHLSRITSDRFEIRRLSHDDLTEKCTNIFIKEFIDFIGFLSACCSANLFVPPINEVVSKTKAIYGEAFSNVDSYALQVPSSAKPKQLVKFMENLL